MCIQFLSPFLNWITTLSSRSFLCLSDISFIRSVVCKHSLPFCRMPSRSVHCVLCFAEMFSLVITVAVFSVAKVWKQPRGPRTEEWRKKMWCAHTVRPHSALGKKEILQFATTWMNLEDTVPSEISQPQEDKYCMSPLS